MNLTRKFKVSGRVQGVFFRVSAKQQADALGLRGWVRNCKNGDVEGVASGTAEQLDNFTRWLADGPPLAHVQDLQVEKSDYLAFENFEIR